MSHPFRTARPSWRLLLLATAATGALAQAASAQTAPSAGPAPAGQSAVMALPTVTVTGTGGTTDDRTTTSFVTKRTDAGTKTDTSLLDVPQSVSVIPKEQIQETDAQTLNQALQFTPGVVTETRGGVSTRYDQLTVRGFQADTYFNGLKLINNGWYILPQIDPTLLERVDVFRGPTSVLYGQATAGGLIDQELKLPLFTPYHQVGVEGGNFRHMEGTYDFTGPIPGTDDRWAYRITGVGRAEDGQVRGTRNERLAVAPSVTFRPDDATRLTLWGLYQYDPRSTSYGGIPPQGSVLPGVFGKLPRDFYDGDYSLEKFNRTEVALGTQLEHRFTDAVTLSSRAMWFHTDQSYASVYQTGVEADGYTLDRGSDISRDHDDQGNVDTNVEVRLHTGPVRHVLLGGFDYQHLSTDFRYGFGTAPTLNLFAPNNDQAITLPTTSVGKGYLNQYGLYLQDQMFLGRFVLTLSGRNDWAETFSEQYGTYHQSSSRPTGRAGLTYVFDNGVAPYVSYSEYFNPILGQSAGGGGFVPETGRQYEVGVKYQPRGTNLLLTGALFDLERNNLVTPDLNNPSLSVQSGQARSRGVELEARAALTEHLDLVAAYTYLDTVYTRDNSGLQGKRLPAIPQHSASTFLKYTFGEGPLDGLGIGGGARYTGSTFNDQNTFKVKDFVLADATASYDLGRKFPAVTGASVYFNGRNMLNTKYVSSCYYGDFCAFGYGRQLMAGVRYQW